MSDMEIPATSWAVWAWQAYRDGRLVESYRLEELEAKNKRLNEQMDAIEEMGTESLNALPDCLMRLAPALVENGELKAKLAIAVEAIEQMQTASDAMMLHIARATLAELKGQDE